jgi:hypothetical protein
MKISAMFEHSITHSGEAPLEDIDMEDLIDLAEALPTPTTTHALNEEAYNNVNAMDDDTQILPAEERAAGAHEAAHDDTNDMIDIVDATSAEQEATSGHQTPATSDDEVVRLRLERFESIFATQTVELKNLTPPPQCAQHPEQAEDILEAYLDNTTFTVKIWVNFDAAERVFFEGDRAEDCGKLQFPNARLKSLLKLNATEFNFRNLRLDICTPFRALAEISLKVREQNGDAIVKANGSMSLQLPILHDFLQGCVKKINDARLDCNLSVEGLVGIASNFRRQHKYDDEEDEWECPAYKGGEWAGIEEPFFSRWK